MGVSLGDGEPVCEGEGVDVVVWVADDVGVSVSDSPWTTEQVASNNAVKNKRRIPMEKKMI